MNHAILVVKPPARRTVAPKETALVVRDMGRSCGGCGAGPMEDCDPTCAPPTRMRRIRHFWGEVLVIAFGMTAAGSAATAGMTLLGIVRWR